MLCSAHQLENSLGGEGHVMRSVKQCASNSTAGHDRTWTNSGAEFIGRTSRAARINWSCSWRSESARGLSEGVVVARMDGMRVAVASRCGDDRGEAEELARARRGCPVWGVTASRSLRSWGRGNHRADGTKSSISAAHQSAPTFERRRKTSRSAALVLYGSIVSDPLSVYIHAYVVQGNGTGR
jgi:hypothetical protein